MPMFPFGDVGPVRAYWRYGESDEIEVSPYLGSTVIRGSEIGKDVQEEEQGDAPVDYVTSGRVVEVETPVTRATLELLEQLLGETGDLGSGNVLKLKNSVGCARYEDAGLLVFKPVCNKIVSTNADEWIQIYKAYPTWDWELGFNRGDQRIFMIKWKCFVSQESGQVGEYGTIGM